MQARQHAGYSRYKVLLCIALQAFWKVTRMMNPERQTLDLLLKLIERQLTVQ